jgi:glycine dehydrogenase
LIQNLKNEIDEVVSGTVLAEDSVLKNAPHTMQLAVNDKWDLKYSREKAVFPLEWIKGNKFWPSVRRVNDAYGDRNLVCLCAPVSDYIEG